MAEDSNTPNEVNSESKEKEQQNDFEIELGTTGLKSSGGYVYEDKLKEMQGDKKFNVFQEMEDNEPTIGGILFAFNTIIKQIPWDIHPSKNGIEEDAVFIKSAFNDMNHSFGDLLDEVLTMLPYGVAPMEPVFKFRTTKPRFEGSTDIDKSIPQSRFNDGLIGWEKISLRSQTTIEKWQFTKNKEILGMWQRDDYSGEPQVFIPINKLLLFRTTKRKNNPEGRSIMRNAFKPWFFKTKIENIEGVGIERDLAGLPVARVPGKIMGKNATPEQKATFENFKKTIKNIRRDEQEGIIIPSDVDESGNKLFDISLLTSGGTRQFKTNETIVRYRQEIAMSMLSDFIVLGHEAVGSLALSKDKTNMFGLAVKGILNIIEEMFNLKGIPQLLRINGKGTAFPPKLLFGDIENVDLAGLSQFIGALTGAGIDLTDEKVVNHLMKQANIPVEED